MLFWFGGTVGYVRLRQAKQWKGMRKREENPAVVGEFRVVANLDQVEVGAKLVPRSYPAALLGCGFLIRVGPCQ